MTHAPDVITYSSVVMRDTVCIVLTMEAFLDLYVKSTDILNTYVMTPNREKIQTGLFPEFRDDNGESTFSVRVLYSVKSEADLFRAHLA